jgi:hypothetical protein
VARSVRTIPFAVVSVTPPPAAVTDDQTRSKPKGTRRQKRKPLISDDQWAQIEKAYGYKLDAAIRFEVLRVTTLFVMFELFERAAPPLAEAKKRVQSIKGSAGKFFSDPLLRTSLSIGISTGDFASGCCRSPRRAIPRSPKWKTRRATAKVLAGTDGSAT